MNATAIKHRAMLDQADAQVREALAKMTTVELLTMALCMIERHERVVDIAEFASAIVVRALVEECQRREEESP